MTAAQPGYVIRQAAETDAEALIAYLRALLGEPGIHLIGEPDELSLTVEAERRLIAETTATNNSTMLLAVAEGRIIGDITCRGDGRRAKRHVGLIGISVANGWRDRGIGTALMTAVIDWARAGGVVTRLELLVFVENVRAVHVYEKLGFQVEGRKRRAIFKHGRYQDEYLMALLLDSDH